MNYLKVQTIRLNESPSLFCKSDEATVELWNTTVAQHDLYDPQKEHLVVYALNTKLKVTDWHIVSIGTLNQTLCNPLEVFRPLIVAGANSFLLMHNHPSGDTSPSASDHKVTSQLKSASEHLNIRMMDHVIIDSQNHQNIYSFRSDGKI